NLRTERQQWRAGAGLALGLADLGPAGGGHDDARFSDEAARRCFVEQRQMLVRDAQEISVVAPCVWVASVGVNTIGDELLAIAQPLDFMGYAVSRLEAHRHLLEGRLATERN